MENSTKLASYEEMWTDVDIPLSNFHMDALQMTNVTTGWNGTAAMSSEYSLESDCLFIQCGMVPFRNIRMV